MPYYSNFSQTDGLESKQPTCITDAKGRLDDEVFKDGCREINGRKLYARKVLRALIDHAANENAKYAIAKEICDIANSASGNEAMAKGLVALANSWVEYFFLPLFIWSWPSTPEPLPSERQTPLPQDTTALMEIAIKGDQDALSILLHRREGDHCAISSSPNVRNIAYHSSLETPAILKIAHILPHPLAENTAITWDMLKTWASMDIQEEWVGQNFNNPGNAILLTGSIRGLFNSFYLWFEKDVAENTYKIQVDTLWDALVRAYQDKLVTFVDHSDTGIQLPSPEALAIHASFAKAFNASGVAEYFGDVLSDQEIFEVDDPTDLALALRFHNPQ